MTVLNARDLPRTGWPENTLYIGRNTQLLARSGVSGAAVHGNPFRMVTQDQTERRRVIDAHRGYLAGRMLDPGFKAVVQGMTGRNLVCHCAPQACHGHTYESALHSMAQDKPALVATPQHHLLMTAAIANSGTALKQDTHPTAEAASIALRSLAVAQMGMNALVRSPEGAWTTFPEKLVVSPELTQLGQDAHKSIAAYITARGAETPAGMNLTQGLIAVGKGLEMPQIARPRPTRTQAEAEF